MPYGNRQAIEKRLKRSINRFAAASSGMLIAGCIATYFGAGAGPALSMLAVTAPVIAVFDFTARYKADLFRRPDGEKVDTFETANILTAVRIFLVPPVMVLLEYGYILEGGILFVVAALTDVADGMAARGLGQETRFGLMVDPVGDIISNIALFTWLWVSGGFPVWLFVLLCIRYGQFFAGLGVLTLVGRRPKLHATIAGKSAGVVQTAGIVALLAARLRPDIVSDDMRVSVIYPALAAAFVVVIISQTVIGLRAAAGEQG